MCQKRWQKSVLSNPGRASYITAGLATAAVCKKSKQALSALPELITFYNTGKGEYLRIFVLVMLYKRIKI